MRAGQTRLTDWSQTLQPDGDAQLVLVFGCRALLADDQAYPLLRQAYPNAIIAGCSTAGEISDIRVSDDELVLTAIQFSSTRVRYEKMKISEGVNSRVIGEQLVKALLEPEPDLVHVLILSDGLLVNGSELVEGMKNYLPAGVCATGGMAGDGADFQQTAVIANSGAEQGLVVAIGFYGSRLQVGSGCMGGWDAFGPDRRITRSCDNVLYELDGQPALDLFKLYLGQRAQDLPSSGLLFPLAVEMPGTSERVVRTILAINIEEKSLTFAGNMPQGAQAQLMRANSNRLVDGAIEAARLSKSTMQEHCVQLAILISCVGRKLILRQRVEEEVEGVRSILGPQAILAGFYSYGEIAPHTGFAACELHNQTVTITVFTET